MKYFKVTITASTRDGRVFNKDSFFYAESKTEANKRVERLPIYKKAIILHRSRVEEVCEGDFIIGSIKDVNFDRETGCEVTGINSLPYVVSRMQHLFDGRFELSSEIAKELKDICNNYVKATPAGQYQIEKEFYKWAHNQIVEAAEAEENY